LRSPWRSLPFFWSTFPRPTGAARLASLVWGALLILASWLLARPLAGRINRLTGFVDRLLDMSVPRPQLPPAMTNSAIWRALSPAWRPKSKSWSTV